MDAATVSYLQAYAKMTPQQQALIQANIANAKVTGVPLSSLQTPDPIISGLAPDQQAQVLNMVAQNQASLQGLTNTQQQALLSLMSGVASVGNNALNMGYLSYVYNNPQALQQYATANGISMQALQPYVDAVSAYYGRAQPGAGGGYQGQTMQQAGGGPGAGTAGTGTPGTGGTPAQGDAFAQIQAILNQYGLGGLSQWAWGEITAGQTSNQVLISMQDQPAYKARFPGIDAMRNAGLAVPTPAEYLNVENSYKQVMQRYGITVPGNPTDFVPLFTGQVSASELEERSSMYDKIINFYGPRLSQQFDDYAGIHGVTNSQLYQMMAGLDNGDLAKKYSAATNTEFGPLTFAHIKDAEAKAESAMQSEFRAGGMVASGATAGTEEQIIRSRAAQNLTTAPVSTPAKPVGGSI